MDFENTGFLIFHAYMYMLIHIHIYIHIRVHTYTSIFSYTYTHVWARLLGSILSLFFIANQLEQMAM